jgi:hypothetical protein
MVRVRCENCGPRLVTLPSVRLLGRGDRWEYAFTCTGCGSRVRRSADAALQAVLRSAGAAELAVHASDRAAHQESAHEESAHEDSPAHPIGS